MAITDINKSFTNLRSNPYTLSSLADREKFHTGFLAACLNQYGTGLLSALCPSATFTVSQIHASVENKCVDLTVSHGHPGHFLLAAEVKLKTDLSDENLERLAKDTRLQDAQKLLIGLFPPANAAHKQRIKELGIIPLPLANLPAIIRPFWEASESGDTKDAIRIWLNYLDALGTVAQYFQNLKTAPVSDKSIIQELNHLKLKGIFERYRLSLVLDLLMQNGLSKLEGFTGYLHNTHGNTLLEIYRPIYTSRASKFGLQWQGNALKLFIEVKQESQRAARDEVLSRICADVVELYNRSGRSKLSFLKLNQPGKFRSATILRWNIMHSSLDDKHIILLDVLRLLNRHYQYLRESLS